MVDNLSTTSSMGTLLLPELAEPDTMATPEADGALMKFEVEEDKLLREMGGFEVVEAAESTVSEEVVDVVIVVVLKNEVVATEEVTGVVDLQVLVIDQLEGSKALSEAQTELG
ncbi:proline-rich receptor-like kinase, putative (DUF1421) [Actinidia rufa]|uniref:Proline-rich receptor-like kinase, putative (DUF1421) n=1 Tax=Actinidia rufa TaxID=165716 RepID=A0A7J0DHK8_9ERIC|nr:proline-rich receptor-like kinase, putative (DUF1421) [Actinidia rufa]